MRFGYSQNLHDLTKKRDYGDLLDELRELAVICDRAGMDTFWLPEHHFSIWGRELIPNPILLAADLAARTERIRIGLAAAIVTFWHPLRVAEDLAMLDHLTGGRLELGVGRGNYGLEAQNLNPIADPNNQAMNIKVFDETVTIIKKALGEESFSFKGEIYQFPAPGFKADRAHSVDDPAYIDPTTKELTKISIYPRAKQKPLPPMWQVVNSIESIQHAARQDMGIIMWRPGVKSLKERLRVYREAVRTSVGRDLPIGGRAGILRDTFVARSEREAVNIAGQNMMGALNFSNWRGPSIYLDPGEKLALEEEARLKKHLPYEFVRDRCVWFGEPSRIIDKVDELHRETRMENVIFKCSWPGMSPSDTRESVRLLCSEVLPVLKSRYPQVGATTAAAD
jgi:alkanesulfonate monooxygenase SsuD/methylene tetrahydromethanopterin reductase-like flavin-dependent oxidoreductase (luciferase family)